MREIAGVTAWRNSLAALFSERTILHPALGKLSSYYCTQARFAMAGRLHMEEPNAMRWDRNIQLGGLGGKLDAADAVRPGSGGIRERDAAGNIGDVHSG